MPLCDLQPLPAHSAYCYCVRCDPKALRPVRCGTKRPCSSLQPAGIPPAPTSVPPLGGPGTELHRLLDQWGIHGGDGCGCEAYARLMDAWGPEGCRQRRQEILDRLEEQAAKRPILGRLPFRRQAAGWLLDTAIRRAETAARAVVLPETEYITTARLVTDTETLLGRLPPDIDAVVGIARSGLLPASVLACRLHVPLWSTGSGHPSAVVAAGGGIRMADGLAGGQWRSPRHVLLCDDTAWSGHAMRTWLPVVRSAFPEA
ncbi:MAG: phosphoribosyltransferase domain-containing protein, partial [Thermoguttaceae bacterium]|nr:phosphoribosyltransferase domain-containing protein [Thermoguttaceae bacterium]